MRHFLAFRRQEMSCYVIEKYVERLHVLSKSEAWIKIDDIIFSAFPVSDAAITV